MVSIIHPDVNFTLAFFQRAKCRDMLEHTMNMTTLQGISH